MDQAAEDRIQHEIEDEAKKLFPGVVRRVEWLHYGDEPVIEPGGLLPRFVVRPVAAGWRLGRHGTRDVFKAFQRAHGPVLKRFRHEMAQRWPEIRYIGVLFEDDSGRHRGGMIQALDDKTSPTDSDVPVTVRLGAAELGTADSLIIAGTVSSRAEAIRWALSRIREQPDALRAQSLPRFLGVRSQAELLCYLFRSPALPVASRLATIRAKATKGRFWRETGPMLWQRTDSSGQSAVLLAA